MTPMLTVLALAAFAVTGTTRYRTLWIAAGLVFAAWFELRRNRFLDWPPQLALQRVGQIGYSVNRGVGRRLDGDPPPSTMQYFTNRSLRALRRRGVHRLAQFRRRRTWLISGFAAAPFVLVALHQSYGGG